MKKQLLNLCVIFAMAILLPACKKKVVEIDQNTIYTVYELYYNANTDKTVAIALFRENGMGGNMVDLKSPASVTFNGDIMEWSPDYSGYAKEYSGKLTAGTFVYKNTDNIVYTNTTPLMDSLVDPHSFATIYRVNPYNYAWTGNPIAQHERINLHIGSWWWNSDGYVSAVSVGATSITLSTNQLNAIYPGVLKTYLERLNTVSLTQGTAAGGEIRTRYMAPNVMVNFAP